MVHREIGSGVINMEDVPAGLYLPLREDNIAHDGSNDNRLKELGYKQELSRSLSAIANFSVTFSIVSVMTGLTTTYRTGLTFGGPVTMVYGWPIVGMLTLLVGLSMAEICSAYPTSGGLYFWSSRLCGDQWGPFASWITGWYVISSFAFGSGFHVHLPMKLFHVLEFVLFSKDLGLLVG